MSFLLNQTDLYSGADTGNWKGRIDGQDKDWLRWHQQIDCVNLHENTDLEHSVTFLGFCSDEGVARNQGRVGAIEGPMALRSILANLPVHFSDEVRLKDAGDILVKNNDLELSQMALGKALAHILNQGGFPVVLGGGHEVTYGHYLGIREFLQHTNSQVGIINLDAHLDMREWPEGKGNSGTGFYQIAQDQMAAGEKFHYLAMGIQEISNTKGLINYAKAKGVQIIDREAIVSSRFNSIRKQIEAFAKEVDYVYLTIDLDVFAASYAPGVSAPAFNGIIPDELFFSLYDVILQLPNLKSVDLAELNPTFDIDARTAKLAADLIFKLLKRF